MNKPQIKMLQKIQKLSFLDSTNTTAEEKAIISFLQKNGYITQKANPNGGPKPAYVISESGKAELYDRHSKQVQVWVPIGISIFAAIGAYREEISSLLQAIMKLLKHIAGS